MPLTQFVPRSRLDRMTRHLRVIESTPHIDVEISPSSCVLQAIGFGLITGWLELALVLASNAIDPRISMSALRTNRHFPWMIVFSNLFLFGAIGLVVALLARRWPALGKWLTARIYLVLCLTTLLLEVDGLHQVACLTLATGIATAIGPALARGIGRFRRPTRILILSLGLGVIPLTLVTFRAVTLAESRALATLPGARPGTPNVLLVVLDNVRASSLSLLGRDRPTTPNLERLAHSGVLFTQARSTSSWTLPSHASIFTGQWCHELSFDFDLPLEATSPTLAEALAGRGFATAGFVANTYYGNILYGLGRGFARYEDHYENLAVTPFEIVRSTSLGKILLHALGYRIRVDEDSSIRKSAEMINRDALDWLDHRPPARPFFLFLNYFDAHAPFIPPDGPDPRFGMAALPMQKRSEIVLKDVRLASETPNSVATRNPHELDQIRQDAASVRLDSYESCIAYLDRQIGLLFDELDRRGLRENTLIIVTSDHGEHLSERGFYGHGLSLYRPEVHVPLLIFPPVSANHPAGQVVDTPASLRDIAATVVDLLGVSDTDQVRFPGQSLARYWKDPSNGETSRPLGEASPLLMELGHRKNFFPSVAIPASLGIVQALVKNGKVYIRNADGREELYDLRSDPSEKHNLIAMPGIHRDSLPDFRSDFDKHFSHSEPD